MAAASATLLTPLAATHSPPGARMLVVIDSLVEAYQILTNGVLPGARVKILKPNRPGIKQISEILALSRDLSSLHLICHGCSGAMQLGDTQIDEDNLEDYRHELQQWARAFTEKPDILLYGCNVASGETGRKFIQRLGEITSANIAASAMLVGNAAKGGKWELNSGVGQVSSGLALLPEAMSSYPGVLVTFTPATNFTVGTNPISVAVGDFNGDSKVDLAVANAGSSSVSVLLGNGNGTFGTATNSTVGTNPRSVAVGDFNGDSKVDLAVANAGSSSVSVLLGNGNGTFGTATNFTVGTSPYSVAVGDFNGDSKVDLAVANNGSSSVSVLLGNGNGTFATATNSTVGSSPRSVAVGDFNGDSKVDLAVANNGSSSVSVLLGNGNGTFATATNSTVGSSPRSVAVGNFNGDSNPDLAVANQSSNSVSVLLNTTTTAVPEPTLHWQTLLFIIVIGGISLWRKQLERSPLAPLKKGGRAWQKSIAAKLAPAKDAELSQPQVGSSAN